MFDIWYYIYVGWYTTYRPYIFIIKGTYYLASLEICQYVEMTYIAIVTTVLNWTLVDFVMPRRKIISTTLGEISSLTGVPQKNPRRRLLVILTTKTGTGSFKAATNLESFGFTSRIPVPNHVDATHSISTDVNIHVPTLQPAELTTRSLHLTQDFTPKMLHQ